MKRERSNSDNDPSENEFDRNKNKKSQLIYELRDSQGNQKSSESCKPLVPLEEVTKTTQNEYDSQILLNKLKSCGSDTERCLNLFNETLSQFPLLSQSVCADFCLSVLEVCMEAAKKCRKLKSSAAAATNHNSNKTITDNPKLVQFQNIIEIIDLVTDKCPTSSSCWLKSIAICGRLGNCQKAIEIFWKLHLSNSIISDVVVVQNYDEKYDRTNVNEKALLATLSTCVSTGQWELALNVLSNKLLCTNITTVACNIIFHAMMSAKEGIAAIQLLERMMKQQQEIVPTIDNIKYWPLPNTQSFLYVMNALYNHSLRMKNKNDALLYVDQAYGLLNTISNLPNNDHYSSLILLNADNFDLLIRAYRTYDDLKMIAYIEEHRNNTLTTYMTPDEVRKSINRDDIIQSESLKQQNELKSFVHWHDDKSTSNDKQPYFQKHGGGRVAYWEFASYTNSTRHFIVAFQPNREPSKNGIKLLLYDNKKDQQKCDKYSTSAEDAQRNSKSRKVGFMLLQNTAIETSDDCQLHSQAFSGKSVFLGLFLDPAYRKENLSKVFFAIWLDLCLKSNLIPETGVMNKPLLALVLQNTFHFLPLGIGGFDVEILKQQKERDDSCDSSMNENSQVIELYSPDASKTLVGGAFAKGELKRENIRLVSEFEYSRHGLRGCIIRLGCTLVLNWHDVNNHERNFEKSRNQAKSAVREIIDEQIRGFDGNGRISYTSDAIPWKNVMLGI